MELLVIEDELGIQTQLKWGLTEHTLHFACNREEAINTFLEHDFPVVTLDLGLPPDQDNASEGLSLLKTLLAHKPQTKIIVLTGSEQHKHALEATELGACNFLQKGIPIDELKYHINAAYTMYLLEQENRALKNTLSNSTPILGNSGSITKILLQLNKIAQTSLTTLLLGESGTGKELFAHSLHDLSKRSGEFIAINCASIPEALLESELFGHTKGAFTGAHKTKTGKIQLADKGTLFLDEIGDMPLDLQAKLLRFLQEREIEPVGGSKKISVDVRVVCATHRDLNEMTKNGQFREDLYYRLSEFILKIPALRDRDNDVIDLAYSFLEQYKQELNSQVEGFSADALLALEHYQFPGNIRELQNKIKTALILAEYKLITAENLSLPLTKEMKKKSHLIVWEQSQNKSIDTSEGLTVNFPEQITMSKAKEILEIALIKREIERCQGNIKQVAQKLNIARSTYYALAQRYQF